MMMQQIVDLVQTFGGALVLSPTEGSEHPETSWGDHFVYYGPDGQVPNGQPYATIVTKDYPEDRSSGLDTPGRWRVNIHVGPEVIKGLLGPDVGTAGVGTAHVGTPDVGAVPDPADTLILHPVYGAWGWVAVVNPGARTGGTVRTLLRQAHDDARRRADRRVRRTDWSD